MSVREIKQCVHDLTDIFQAVLSAVEMALMLYPQNKELRIARVQLRRGMVSMRRIQALAHLLEEEAREQHIQ
jgi:hypothetical protein